jgi:hypothetical protein
LDKAILSFEWRFVGLAEGSTLLTQRITLEGEKADVYLSQVQAAFTANPLAAMNKLAIAMAKADPRSYGPNSGSNAQTGNVESKLPVCRLHVQVTAGAQA